MPYLPNYFKQHFFLVPATPMTRLIMPKLHPSSFMALERLQMSWHMSYYFCRRSFGSCNL